MARRVGSRADLSVNMDHWLAHEGPYLLEVVVGKEDNVFPMMPSGAGVEDMRLS